MTIDTTPFWTICLTVFILSTGLTILLKRFAPRLRLIDVAGHDARKLHTGKPALVGGIAIVISSLAVLSLLNLIPHSLTFGLLAFLALGVYDDAKAIPALPKLSLQIIIILIAVSALKLNIHDFGYLIDSEDYFQLSEWSIPITALCILVFVNAFNLIDGLDGFSGGIATIMFAFFTGISWSVSIIWLTYVFLILIAAVAGFLIFNMRSPLRQKASVFLGDGGSLSLGFSIAWGAITLNNEFIDYPNTLPPVLVYAFILAYPILDMLTVMSLRKLDGQSIFSPDNMHLHFLMSKTGLSNGKVCVVLLTLATLYASLGVFAWQLGFSNIVMLGLWFGLLGLHVLIYKALLKV